MIRDTNPRILLVEDEIELAELMRDYLLAAHYRVEMRHSGSGIVDQVRRDPPDLILLDLMLPGEDGLSICTRVRRFSSLPIIITTAKVEEIDRLLGFELGADDYVCKPYKPREVIARIKAVLRRTQSRGAGWATPELVLDPSRYQATLNGKRLDLTPTEFRLLNVLADSPGRIYSREQLLGAAFDDGRIVGNRAIDTHMKNLRHKLRPHLEGADPICSVYGVGYKLEWGLER